MRVYYNDNDRFCAQWLRNLCEAGLIPAGDVDERDIRDVQPGDIAGYDQCHWFAGLGAWALALRLAGWPADRFVWTGSCPCQPFSVAGAQAGADDERHLWDAWFRLIRECRPDCVVGEQVPGAIGFGWLDRVCADMEASDYACGAVVLGAHSVGAPHIRQRLWWCAQRLDHAAGARCDGAGFGAEDEARDEARMRGPECGCATGGLADADRQPAELQFAAGGNAGSGAGEVPCGHGSTGGVADAVSAGWSARRPGAGDGQAAGGGASFWSDAVWLPCLDGKARRAQPDIFPLAANGEWGSGSRVGILRAAGNCISPPLAAEFIRAVMECVP